MSSTMHVLSKIVRYVKYRFSPVLIVNGYFFVNNGKLEKNNFDLIWKGFGEFSKINV